MVVNLVKKSIFSENVKIYDSDAGPIFHGVLSRDQIPFDSTFGDI